MDAKKLIPVAIIGAGAYYLVTRGFNTAQAVGKLKAVGFKVLKFNASPFNMSLELLLKVENPGSANIPLEYYTGSIIYQGSTLSNFSFNGNGKNFSLKPRAITEIPFTARISNIGAIAQIISVVKKIAAGQPVDTVFNIQSNLYAGGIDLPVNFSHDLKPSVVSGLGRIKVPGLLKARLRRRGGFKVSPELVARLRAKKLRQLKFLKAKGLALSQLQAGQLQALQSQNNTTVKENPTPYGWQGNN